MHMKSMSTTETTAAGVGIFIFLVMSLLYAVRTVLSQDRIEFIKPILNNLLH